MSPTMYDDVHAKCPYFRSSEKTRIRCEGITEDSVLILEFANKEGRNLQRRVFCNKKFQNCEIYRMMEEKYSE